MAGTAKSVARRSARQDRPIAPFKETIEKKGAKYTTARDAALRGELPYLKFGRAWYCYPDEVDDWIEAARVQPD
jgi:hypothetical protein